MIEIPPELAEDMLQPLDDDRAEFMVKLAEDVFRIADAGGGTDHDMEILRIASSNLICLVATSLAGYHLYADYQEMARKLHHDAKLYLSLLGESAPHILDRLDTSAMKEYEEYSAVLPTDILKEDQ